MQFARLGALAFSVSLFACGDDGGTKLIDSGIGNTDAPPKVCTTISPGAGDINSETLGSVITFFNPANETVGADDAAIFTEFYRSVTPNITGAIDIATGDHTDYATCGVCFLVGTADAQGNETYYFQQEGTITFDEDPITARRLNLTVSNLKLQEVSFDQDFSSTFLPTGDCVTLSGTFMEDNIPAEWDVASVGCGADKYYTGPTGECDCGCGLYDPDCRYVGRPVNGCSGGTPACWPDATAGTTCVAKPANDTCATAATLTAGVTGLTGTTIGADRDYNRGLELASCTNFRQSGPDVVYKVTLAADTTYTFNLSALAADFDGGISLVGPDANDDASDCTDMITTCVKGADVGVDGESETFQYMVPANMGGTYYVIVDGFRVDAGGTFTVSYQ